VAALFSRSCAFRLSDFARLTGLSSFFGGGIVSYCGKHMLRYAPNPPNTYAKTYRGAPRGTPAGRPNGPAAVLWDTQGGATWKCAVSQDPAVVGPATQLVHFFFLARFAARPITGAAPRLAQCGTYFVLEATSALSCCFCFESGDSGPEPRNAVFNLAPFILFYRGASRTSAGGPTQLGFFFLRRLAAPCVLLTSYRFLLGQF
jgi:hypothetical protein